MKKLLVGLCLTVGISGMSLANDIKDYDQNDLVSTEVEMNIKNDELAITTCYTQALVKIYDCNGDFVETRASSLRPVDCGPNQSEGDVTITRHTLNLQDYNLSSCN